jgi:hypothetical protein
VNAGIVTPSALSDGTPPQDVVHYYSTPTGIADIAASGQINPSMFANDARHGDGVYFTRISPGSSLTAGQVSRQLFGNPLRTSKVKSFVSVDTYGRPRNEIGGGAQTVLVPTNGPLNVQGRMRTMGPSGF